MQVHPVSAEQDKDGKVTYPFDLTAWLNGGALDSFTITTDLTVDSQSNTTEKIVVTLSGGDAGEVYPVIIHVVASDDQEDDIEIYILIK